jgi:hypothetical protein
LVNLILILAEVNIIDGYEKYKSLILLDLYVKNILPKSHFGVAFSSTFLFVVLFELRTLFIMLSIDKPSVKVEFTIILFLVLLYIAICEMNIHRS